MSRVLLLSLVAGLLAACTPAAAPEAPHAAPASETAALAPWVEKVSPDPVAGTVARLTRAIEAGGAMVVAVVDHRANATKAGLDLPETTVVIFGNAAVGTPLMQADRRVALDLPLKVLVWRDGGVTRVGYLPPRALAARYGIAADHPSVAAMTGALDRLTDAAIAPSASPDPATSAIRQTDP